MKGKAKIWDLMDISGTVCCPNAVLAYLRADKCSTYLMRTWPLFYCPRQPRGYYQNN